MKIYIYEIFCTDLKYPTVRHHFRYTVDSQPDLVCPLVVVVVVAEALFHCSLAIRNAWQAAAATVSKPFHPGYRFFWWWGVSFGTFSHAYKTISNSYPHTHTHLVLAGIMWWEQGLFGVSRHMRGGGGRETSPLSLHRFPEVRIMVKRRSFSFGGVE